MCRMILATLVAVCVAGCVPAGAGAQRPSSAPYGAAVTFLGRDGGSSSPGELLAVSPDSAWLRVDRDVRSFALRDVARVNVARNVSGAARGFKWMGIVGAATGLGMSLACSSLGDTSGCWNMFPISVGLSGLMGLFAAPSMEGRRWAHPPAQADSLRAWARFPQGLPQGVPRDSLIKGPTAPLKR